MLQAAEFRFLDPGDLFDAELSLTLVRRRLPEPAKGWVPAYDFDMRRTAVLGAVGHVSFRAVTTQDIQLYTGHFGYSVDPAHRGHHYAERAVRLLFPFARRHGLSTVWITCNPDNLASRRTLERLGGQLIEIVSLPADNEMYRRGERSKCRFLFRLQPG